MLKTSNFCTLTHGQRVLLLLRCTSDAERRGSQTALFSLTLEGQEAECQVTKGAHDWSWAKNRAPLTLTVPPSARFSRVQDYNSYRDRKSTRLNSSHQIISYAVFCLKKKNNNNNSQASNTPPH